MLRITALMENRAAAGSGLECEHGLSFFVVYRGRRILFDCGKTGAFLENAARLGICLDNLDTVVLSHGHYDHAGGYPALVEAGLAPGVLFTGIGFFEKKLSRQDDRLLDRSAGFSPELLKEGNIVHLQADRLLELFPGVWLLGDFTRKNSYETIPEKFLRQTPGGAVPDDFSDEVALAFSLPEGLAVLVGCAHPGIVNMLSAIGTRLGRPITAVFGGTHLMGAGEERIVRTLSALKEMGIRRLGLSHCTGAEGEAAVLADGWFQSCNLCAGQSICLCAEEGDTEWI